MTWYCSQTLCLYGRSTDASIGAPEKRIDRLEFAVLDRDRLASREPSINLQPERILTDRFAQQQKLCALIDRNQVLSYCWMAFQPTDVSEIELVFQPTEGDVYFYDAFTLAVHRGGGLYPALLELMNEWAHERSYQRALIFASRDNRPSRRGIEKAGFRLLQRAFFLRILSMRFHRFTAPSGTEKRLHFTAREKAT